MAFSRLWGKKCTTSEKAIVPPTLHTFWRRGSSPGSDWRCKRRVFVLAGSTPDDATMKLRGHKNSKKQGDVGLGVAIAWFTAEGHTVCVPLTDSQDYDLVIDDGRLNKVQVKTTTVHQDGSYVVELRTSGGNRSGTGKTKKFDSTQIDILFVVTDDGTKYLIPSSEISSTCRLSLGTKYRKYRLS